MTNKTDKKVSFFFLCFVSCIISIFYFAFQKIKKIREQKKAQKGEMNENLEQNHGLELSLPIPSTTNHFERVSFSSNLSHSRIWPDFSDIFDGVENIALLHKESDPSLHRQVMYELLKRKLWKYSHSSMQKNFRESKCVELLSEAGFKSSFLQALQTKRAKTMSILHFAITIMDNWAWKRQTEIKLQNEKQSCLPRAEMSNHREIPPTNITVNLSTPTETETQSDEDIFDWTVLTV